MEDYIRDLDKTIMLWQTYFEKFKAESSMRITKYEATLKSKNVSEAERLRALVGRAVEYNCIDNLSSDLLILHHVKILALNIEMSRIRIHDINERLTKSGILEKAKDIQDIKKLKKELDRFTRLLKEVYEKKRQMEETCKALQYIS